MMVNLMGLQCVDRNLLPPAERLCGHRTDGPRVAESQEPIHVHVRVREYGGCRQGISLASSAKPDLARMPVGTLLDCYV